MNDRYKHTHFGWEELEILQQELRDLGKGGPD